MTLVLRRQCSRHPDDARAGRAERKPRMLAARLNLRTRVLLVDSPCPSPAPARCASRSRPPECACPTHSRGILRPPHLSRTRSPWGTKWPDGRRWDRSGRLSVGAGAAVGREERGGRVHTRGVTTTAGPNTPWPPPPPWSPSPTTCRSSRQRSFPMRSPPRGCDHHHSAGPPCRGGRRVGNRRPGRARRPTAAPDRRRPIIAFDPSPTAWERALLSRSRARPRRPAAVRWLASTPVVSA